jgi:predicted pyridoxine 5'-phosphate oxidase superfamily flavin-nucleotide-binding protein
MAELYRSEEQETAVRRWCELRLRPWPVDHTRHVVDTHLGPTHVLAAGAGPATVLALPGTGFNAATSLSWVAALSTSSRVLVADLPGQPGLSAAPRPSDETNGYAAWVDDLLAWAGRDGGPVVVAGHSRGAAVALSADPARAQGLVLLGPAGLVGARVGLRALRAAARWAVLRNDAASRRLLDLMAGPSAGYPGELVEWMTLVARATRTTGAPGPLPAPLVTRWRGGNVRVLVGEHDCFFPPARVEAASLRLLALTPSVVGGAGHLLPDERPDAVGAAVHEVLTLA